jgi:DNA repair exonuclease SbcCD ATPase subunit
MRYLVVLVFCATLVLGDVAVSSTPASAQTSAQEKAASLRAQLSEVEARQAELQNRLQQLDEESKPENIEKSLAGVGSTKPEELREQRRRQLEIERNGIQAQLNLLATSHTRLQTAIAQADADAYRQSAAPVSASPSNSSSITASSTGAATTPTRARRHRRRKAKRAKSPSTHPRSG